VTQSASQQEEDGFIHVGDKIMLIDNCGYRLVPKDEIDRWVSPGGARDDEPETDDASQPPFSSDPGEICAELERLRGKRESLLQREAIVRQCMGGVLACAYKADALSFNIAAKLAGVAPSTAYKLMAEAGFSRPVKRASPRV
jgi:hypothetical protein